MSHDLPWVVCDVETTGLHPSYHHRVVEIALVCGQGARIDDEWTSLLCPDRDIGAGEIHGLFGRDLHDAPRFSDIAGSITARLRGRLVVAHNAKFDEAFLVAEFARAELNCPQMPWLCTLELVRSVGLTGGRLSDCCDQFGIDHSDAHTALGDARATAQLLTRCLREVAINAEIPPVSTWPVIDDVADARPRGARTDLQPSYLAELVASRPTIYDLGLGADTIAYLELLDRVLEDRKVSETEAAELASCASMLGLSQEAMNAAHRHYLASLVDHALADHVITEREERDLDCVSELLGMPWRDVAPEPAAVPMAKAAAVGMSGQSVCFTGALTCTYDGELLTRDRAHALASVAGLEISNNVTRKLDLLVVADPDSLSGKARKAREYGTRIVAESAFWAMLGVEVA
jgi:DNA polymerase-3 subunit epsilon